MKLTFVLLLGSISAIECGSQTGFKVEEEERKYGWSGDYLIFNKQDHLNNVEKIASEIRGAIPTTVDYSKVKCIKADNKFNVRTNYLRYFDWTDKYQLGFQGLIKNVLQVVRTFMEKFPQYRLQLRYPGALMFDPSTFEAYITGLNVDLRIENSDCPHSSVSNKGRSCYYDDLKTLLSTEVKPKGGSVDFNDDPGTVDMPKLIAKTEEIIGKLGSFDPSLVEENPGMQGKIGTYLEVNPANPTFEDSSFSQQKIEELKLKASDYFSTFLIFTFKFSHAKQNYEWNFASVYNMRDVSDYFIFICIDWINCADVKQMNQKIAYLPAPPEGKLYAATFKAEKVPRPYKPSQFLYANFFLVDENKVPKKSSKIFLLSNVNDYWGLCRIGGKNRLVHTDMSPKVTETEPMKPFDEDSGYSIGQRSFYGLWIKTDFKRGEPDDSCSSYKADFRIGANAFDKSNFYVLNGPGEGNFFVFNSLYFLNLPFGTPIVKPTFKKFVRLAPCNKGKCIFYAYDTTKTPEGGEMNFRYIHMYQFHKLKFTHDDKPVDYVPVSANNFDLSIYFDFDDYEDPIIWDKFEYAKNKKFDFGLDEEPVFEVLSLPRATFNLYSIDLKLDTRPVLIQQLGSTKITLLFCSQFTKTNKCRYLIKDQDLKENFKTFIFQFEIKVNDAYTMVDYPLEKFERIQYISADKKTFIRAATQEFMSQYSEKKDFRYKVEVKNKLIKSATVRSWKAIGSSNSISDAEDLCDSKNKHDLKQHICGSRLAI